MNPFSRKPRGADFIRSLRYRHDSLSEAGIPPLTDDEHMRQEAMRRAQMTHAVRIASEITPGIARAVETVRERLGLDDMRIEAYLNNSPEVQAASLGGGPGVVLIALNAGLVRLVSEGELMCVIGHELGHHLMGHHDYPIETSVDAEAAGLNWLALQRASEISADRVAFLAAPAPGDAFRTILKTVSGLPDTMLRFDFDALLAQASEIKQLGGSEYELKSTHPMFAARIQALMWFERSAPYHRWAGLPGKASLTATVLDEKIDRELAAASGFRLADIYEKTVDSALMWSMIALFLADKRLSKADQAHLERRFGSERTAKAVAFVKEQGPAGVRRKFEDSLRDARSLKRQLKQTLYDDLRDYARQSGGEDAPRADVLQTVRKRLSL